MPLPFCRFDFYGIRNVASFAMGTSKFFVRFAMLNALGAIIWAAVLACLGYFFGQAVEVAMGRYKSASRSMCWWAWVSSG